MAFPVLPHSMKRWRRTGAKFAMLSLPMLFAMSLAASPARAGERISVGEFAFEAPAGWNRMAPPSPMRRAQFRVLNKDGTDGLVIFYHFRPGDGGSVERNLQRWYSHFKEPNDKLGAVIERRKFGAARLVYFRARGTLIGGGGENPGYALHAAILEGDSGRVFVRFTAPQDLATRHRDAFRRMIESPFRD